MLFKKTNFEQELQGLCGDVLVEVCGVISAERHVDQDVGL